MGTEGLTDAEKKKKKKQQQAGLGAAAVGISLATGLTQLSGEREAAAISQTSLVRQAVDRSIQVQESFQREQAISGVVIGESPGASEQVQRAIQESAGATAVDQLIINQELKAQLDAIKSQFKNRGALIGLEAASTLLPFLG